MSVEDKIHLIQKTFQKAKGIRSLQEFNVAVSKLNKETPDAYISVVYEGASAGIALESFKNTNSIAEWVPYYECFGEKHSSQILVGLGWALFECGHGLSQTLNDLEQHQAWRVLDGYGFCNGLFKRSESIRKQLIPKELDKSLISGYHQGLGRSLWYISRGNVEHLVRMIHLFPVAFHSDIWRGIGIAVTYVGGVNELLLSNLQRDGKSNLPSLKSGIAGALHSRKKAHSFSEDAVLTGSFFSIDIPSAVQKIELIEHQKYNSLAEYKSILKAVELDL